MSHLHPLHTDPRSPHACRTPGVYTFTVTQTILRMLTSISLGFNNKMDQKSLSSAAATRPLPRVLTSSEHSLTWREFLIGLATCSFQPQLPLSPRERISHRLDNLLLQPDPQLMLQQGAGDNNINRDMIMNTQNSNSQTLDIARLR
jgi:hypothetical protein